MTKVTLGNHSLSEKLDVNNLETRTDRGFKCFYVDVVSKYPKCACLRQNMSEELF